MNVLGFVSLLLLIVVTIQALLKVKVEPPVVTPGTPPIPSVSASKVAIIEAFLEVGLLWVFWVKIFLLPGA